MKKTRIFVISGHLMFGRGIESLLHQEPYMDVVGQEAEVSQALDRIRELQPDVVILDGDDPELGVASILRTNPDVRVISVSLQNNYLYVYRASQRMTKSVEDLLEAIEEGTLSIRLKDE